MIVAEDARTRIEQLVSRNPDMTAAELGRAVGLTRARVSQILGELGYKLESRWVKSDPVPTERKA